MKVEIERFGPIKRFHYDLDKDFIVTYGNNNIGKSYSMQIIYLLLKTFRNQALASTTMIGAETEALEEGLKTMVADFLGSQADSAEITNIISDRFYQVFTQLFLHEFVHSCQNTFGNFEITLEEDPVIHVNFHQFSFDIHLKEERIIGKINVKTIQLVKTESGFHKSRDLKNVFYI